MSEMIEGLCIVHIYKKKHFNFRRLSLPSRTINCIAEVPLQPLPNST
jgi:hypothetical protein